MTDLNNISDTTMGQRALTLRDIIKIVLPHGTLGSNRWDKVCEWPPDLFAAVATITERSGLYSLQTFTAFWSEDFALVKEWIENVRSVGSKWADTGSPPKYVRTLWRNLIRKHGDALIDDSSSSAFEWKRLVFELLVIADEAYSGIGFFPETEEELSGVIQYLVYKEYVAWSRYSYANPHHVGGDVLPNLPVSLCIQVPRELFCVQPKTRGRAATALRPPQNCATPARDVPRTRR
jgi:hypothetical protein